MVAATVVQGRQAGKKRWEPGLAYQLVRQLRTGWVALLLGAIIGGGIGFGVYMALSAAQPRFAKSTGLIRLMGVPSSQWTSLSKQENRQLVALVMHSPVLRTTHGWKPGEPIHFQLQHVPGTPLMNLAVSAKSPVLAQRLTDAYVTAYREAVERKRQERRKFEEQARNASTAEDIQKLRNELTDLETQIELGRQSPEVIASEVKTAVASPKASTQTGLVETKRADQNAEIALLAQQDSWLRWALTAKWAEIRDLRRQLQALDKPSRPQAVVAIVSPVIPKQPKPKEIPALCRPFVEKDDALSGHWTVPLPALMAGDTVVSGEYQIKRTRATLVYSKATSKVESRPSTRGNDQPQSRKVHDTRNHPRPVGNLVAVPLDSSTSHSAPQLEQGMIPVSWTENPPIHPAAKMPASGQKLLRYSSEPSLKVVRLKNRLAAARAEQARLRSRLATVHTRRKSLDALPHPVKNVELPLPVVEPLSKPAGNLTEQADLNHKKDILLQKLSALQQAQLKSQGHPGEGLVPSSALTATRLVKRPSKIQKPPLPSLPFLLAVSSLLGLLAGTGVLVRKATSSRVPVRPAFVEQTLGLPVLGSIPWIPEKRWQAYRQHNRLEVLSSLEPAVTAAYRQLAQSLRENRSRNQHSALLMASLQKEAGQAPMMANLACVLAQSGERVLMIDGDLARPELQNVLGEPLDYERSLPELINTLAERRSLHGPLSLGQVWQLLESFTKPSGLHPGLDYLNAGLAMENRFGFLEAFAYESDYQDLLMAAKQAYDWVLVDAPPLVYPDAALLLPALDGLCLLVERNTDEFRLGELVHEIHSNSSVIAGLILREPGH